MKFEISKESLVKGITLGTRSMLVKSSLPILSNVLIRVVGENVELITTSLETATRVKLKAKVEKEGETTVLGRALAEYVVQLGEGDATFEKLGEEVVVSSRGTSARFATIAPDEFPAIPKIEGGKKLTIDAQKLSEGASRIIFCAAQDESRPILAGVLFETIKKGVSLVATDGFRLGSSQVVINKGGDGALKFVLPARAVAEIPKIVAELGDGGGSKNGKVVEILVSDNLTQAVFKLENLEFTTRLIEGVYPHWEKLIPTNFTTKAVFKKDDLMRAVKIAAIFAKDAGNIIKLRLLSEGKKGILGVTSNTAQIGSADTRVDADISGTGGEIAFNYRYVLETLSSFDGDEVVFEMNESLNPGRFSQNATDGFFHIIMPVRLQS